MEIAAGTPLVFSSRLRSVVNEKLRRLSLDVSRIIRPTIISSYILLRCVGVGECALREASRLLPALACASDDLERAAFYVSSDLDAEEI
eukprot:1688660-Pleurochrysis_carterae.AAC.1